MLCAAAKAMAHRDFDVHVSTCLEYVDLVRACPWVTTVNHNYAGWYNRVDDCRFGIAGKHQVDAYLEAFGIVEPDPAMKRLELGSFTFLDPLPSGRLCVIHPALTDPNRTWPWVRWVALVDLLKQAGYEVLQVGKEVDGKGVWRLPGVWDLTNRLSLTETIQVIRQAEVFISTDSGPVQMAGASEARIVGIYSSVNGHHRIPFGVNAAVVQAPCHLEGCYRLMHEPSVWAKNVKPDLNDTFKYWCPAETNYACLSAVTPEMVMAAI